MNENMTCTLWFFDLYVGEIRSAFCSEETWFGIVDIALSEAQGAIAQRILEYIAFCEDWNERQRNESVSPAEFERFSDIIGAGKWTVRCSELEPMAVADAPVFFVGNEITWSTP